MKIVKIDSSIEGKIKAGYSTILGRDIDKLDERFTPGQWLLLKGGSCYLASANPFGKNGPVLRVSSKIDDEALFELDMYIRHSIKKAYAKRAVFTYVDEGCRLFFGEEDGLNGLVIDVYTQVVVVSVSSFGIWNKLELIKGHLTELFPEKKIYTLSTRGVNAIEEIPEGDSFDFTTLKVKDSDLLYELETAVLQKGGYYYDHRNNRQKMEAFLSKLKQHPRHGMDLFSYVGSWGMHLLRSGCEKVEFVDQANLDATVSRNLCINNFEERGSFVRGDVYKVLDDKIKKNQKYDIIVADPPAFTKSEKLKANALRGYEKLHMKCLSLLNEGGIYVAASCTSHVSLHEFDETVQVSAKKLRKRLTLADIGIQGEDHVMSGLQSKSNYIKYLLYQVWE